MTITDLDTVANHTRESNQLTGKAILIDPLAITLRRLALEFRNLTVDDAMDVYNYLVPITARMMQAGRPIYLEEHEILEYRYRLFGIVFPDSLVRPPDSTIASFCEALLGPGWMLVHHVLSYRRRVMVEVVPTD